MIRVGGTYSYGNLRFDAHVVFTVVAEAEHLQRDSASPGFLVLILVGTHKGAPWIAVRHAGETFTCAKSSAIANDSVRFPAEE